ncbi:MAG: hypothetical protein JNK45_12225 [Myxococcales bacterium]|nr:hypothetical protein [Myxococcales bacterium]
MRPGSPMWLTPLLLVACSWFASGAASTSAPQPVAVAGVQRLAPAPTDPVPAERGTPAGSLARRPAWRTGDVGYAPILPEADAAALFTAATAATQPRAALDGDLLACRLDVQFEEIKNWSLRPHKWAAADLLIVVGFGPEGATSEGRLATFGPNQRNFAHFVVPAARMGEGDVLDVLVNDRDRLLARDFIDRVPLPWAGSTPLVASTAITSVVCRVVEGEVLAREVQARLWDVDDALAQWRALEPDVRSGTAVCSAPPVVGERVSLLAAVLGWDDPRTLARQDAAIATELAVQQACAERFAAFVAALDVVGAPATLGGTDLGVRVLDGSCAPAAMARLEATAGRSAGGRCTFALELTNRAAVPLELQGAAVVHPDWDVVAFDARGRELTTHGAGAPRSIGAGAVRRLDFTTGDALARSSFGASSVVAAPPVLVELRERGRDGRVVRLRLPRLATQ